MLLSRFKILLFPLFVALLLTSCNRADLFMQTVDVHGAWQKNDAVKFTVPITDTLTPYNFYLDIRHTGKYRFSNLYLFMQTRFPNGTYTKDTIEIMLATVQGKWIGKGWGEIKEDHVLLKSKLKFPMPGNYEFLIWQAMRVDTLRAIKSIGLNIEKVE